MAYLIWTKWPKFRKLQDMAPQAAAILIRPRRTRQRNAAPGARMLGLSFATSHQAVRALSHGFPHETIRRFHASSGLSLNTIAALLQIPARTMVRRKATGRLRPDESERLLRIATVFQQAINLFEGDVAAARQWLTSPAPALGNEIPIQFARTEIGAREVEDLVGRLEHGIFT